jgi:ABC-2 type transport system permease protein
MMALTLKELRLLFLTPRAWLLLGVFQLLLAWLLLIRIEEFLRLQPRLGAVPGAPGVTELVAAPLIDSAATLFMLVMPLVTMRLFSQEFRDGTVDLLLSSPLSATRIVAGKFLALLALAAAVIFMTALLVLSLEAGTTLDRGTLGSGFLGLALALCAFGAIGLLLSTLSGRPSTAAAATYGCLLLLWLIDLAPVREPHAVGLHWLGPWTHLRPLLRGLVDTADIAYFAILTLACLALAVRRLDNLRRGE